MSLFGTSKGGATVGIDIGSSLIKVAEVRPSKEGIQVTALGVIPTPPGTIDNETIVDPQALGQAIKQVLNEHGISSKRSVSSVSGQSSVIVRIIEVPKMTRQELAETMRWEVERHVPFAADEVVMDFQPIERPNASPDDQNMEVLLAVARQDVINGHVETLLAAGLEPVAIDVESLAACRSLIDIAGNGTAEGTVAIISIGASVTEMGIYRDGLLAFPRTLPLAGDAITRSLSENLQLSAPQAEQLKRERGTVLVERAMQMVHAADVAGMPSDGYGESDATIGFAPHGEQESFDNDLSFIPGLGYGFEEPEKQEAPAPTETPDFDIDLGGSGPQAAKQVVDFDLSLGDEDIAPAPAPVLDLSESAALDGMLQDYQAASMADMALPGAAESVDLDSFTEEQIFDAMASVLSDLVIEIRRSIEYYSSRYQSQPNKILLCGGTAKLHGLDRLVEAELGIPVVLANPLADVTVFSRTLSQDYLEEVTAVLPVSIGLAIRDLIGD